MNCLSFIKTDEIEIKTITGSGNNRRRPNDVGPGRIGGASDGVGRGFSDHGPLGDRHSDRSGLGSWTVSDDTQGAIPSILMSMDGQQRPAREQEDR